MKRYCLALDLKDDPQLIKEYEHWHKNENIWTGIKESIKEAGVTGLEIFRTGNRLFMIMETNDDFTFEEKAEKDSNNPKVQEWEEFMWKFQLPLPWAKQGEKWIVMDKIFQL